MRSPPCCSAARKGCRGCLSSQWLGAVGALLAHPNLQDLAPDEFPEHSACPSNAHTPQSCSVTAFDAHPPVPRQFACDQIAAGERRTGGPPVELVGAIQTIERQLPTGP